MDTGNSCVYVSVYKVFPHENWTSLEYLFRFVTGDRVLEINGVSLVGVTHKQAVETLRRSPDVCRLVMQRGTNSSGQKAQNMPSHASPTPPSTTVTSPSMRPHSPSGYGDQLQPPQRVASPPYYQEVIRLNPHYRFVTKGRQSFYLVVSLTENH